MFILKGVEIGYYVVQYIEGEPKINKVPVIPGAMNSKEPNERIAGLNTEDSENNECWRMS